MNLTHDLTPDYHVAINFLKWLYPSGPWLLTGIPFDRRPPFPTSRFSGQTMGLDALLWLQANGEMNLYYHVNEVIEQPTPKKAEKVEIAKVHFLQIDMDVRKVGETEEEAHARIITSLGRYGRRPSALINSGGGYNAIWRLTSPIAMHSESDIEDVEARNRQLAADLEGDVTHDISRILRLPGTVNRLNKIKVERGRVPSLSSLVWVDDATYSLSEFIPAPSAPKNQGTSSARVESISSRTEDLALLPISSSLKEMIASGVGRTPDRSDTLWFVCCELIRLEIRDDVILGLITDSRYRISDHIFAQGARHLQYALRQIRRAKEKAVDPALVEMNDRHAVIKNFGGKCVIMKEPHGVHPMSFQSTREFIMGNDNEKILLQDKVTGKPRLIGKATWWFDQTMRRQYDHVVFEPGKESGADLNLWQGFAVEPKPGNMHDRYMENMFQNICAGDEARFVYLLKWMARVVQFPATQSMVAVVLLGDRGTGKSVFGKGFAKIFGTHAFTAKDAREFTGKFNDHLVHTVFLLAEEAFDIRDKSHESTLKEIITSGSLAREGKGLKITQNSNYIHLMMTSNQEKVIPAGDKERRFFVTRVREKTHSDDWFRIIDEEDPKAGSISHLLHHLLSIDLTDFKVNDYPVTMELREQQDHTITPHDDWLWTKLENGVWLSTLRFPWAGPIPKEMLHREYLQSMASLNVPRPMSQRQFSTWMTKSLPSVGSTQLFLKDHTRPVAFTFPSLSECRAYFASRRGRPDYAWQTETEIGDIVYQREAFE